MDNNTKKFITAEITSILPADVVRVQFMSAHGKTRWLTVTTDRLKLITELLTKKA